MKYTGKGKVVKKKPHKVRIQLPAHKRNSGTDLRTGQAADIVASPKPKTPWPTKSHVRTGKTWVPHPSKPGWEINVMDMSERKIK